MAGESTFGGENEGEPLNTNVAPVEAPAEGTTEEAAETEEVAAEEEEEADGD